MSASAVFWRLAAELQAENPDLVEGTIMKCRCLRVRGEFVALVDEKDAGQGLSRVGVVPQRRPGAVARGTP